MRYFRIEYKRGRQRLSTVVAAESRIEAIKQFGQEAKGVMVSIKEISKPLSLTIEEIVAKWRSPLKKRRVNQEPYIASLRQIAVMLDAGIPINQCIEEAVRSTQDPMVRYIWQSILRDVESGVSLLQAAKPFKVQLGNLSLSMIDLGEQTGSLAESITRLADILEQIEFNRRQLIKATRYPLFTMIAMAIAFTVVIVMVVPQFQQLFAESGAELPFATRLLLWTEEAIVNYGPYILVSSIVMATIFGYIYGKNEKVRLWTDRFLLRIYIVGKVTRYAMIGRFVYIFDVLMRSGIPIMDAIDAAIGVVDNLYIKSRLAHIRLAIEEGRSLHQGFVESKMFMSMIEQMIKAGETSGALSAMLQKITKFYQERYQYIVDNVASMIEPILIAAIAGFVLILALGIFLPMWSMAEAMGV